METNKTEAIGKEILSNLIEFLNAEFNLQMTDSFSNSDKILIMTEVVVNLSLNHFIEISKVLECCPTELYDNLHVRDRLKEIIDDKNES